MFREEKARPMTKQNIRSKDLRSNLITNSQKFRSKGNKSIDFTTTQDTVRSSLKQSIFSQPSYLKSPPASKIKSYIDQHSNWKLCKMGAMETKKLADRTNEIQESIFSQNDQSIEVINFIRNFRSEQRAKRELENEKVSQQLAELDPNDQVFCETLYNFTDASRFEN
jgi:mevalonate pyrophosphate decarboxylase